jgi:hypothetical protein
VFRARRYEGPHRFLQKRSWSFVSTLRNIAVAKSAKNQRLRDFLRRSIFDFCNIYQAMGNPTVSRQSLKFANIYRRLASPADHERSLCQAVSEREISAPVPSQAAIAARGREFPRR